MKSKYSFALHGSTTFLRPAADAQRDILEPYFASDDWEYTRDYFTEGSVLYSDPRPTACEGPEIFGVIVGFIASCFGKKIFDEFYDRIFKRPISAYLDALFAKLEVPLGKVVEYRDVIVLEDIQLVVVIRTLVTKESTKNLQKTVMHGHRIAHAYIETYGKQAPIHCHTIVDGQVPSEPELFDSLEHIKQKDLAAAKLRWLSRT